MTANKMPLMLENPMPVDLQDVDDLFGDGVSLSLPMRTQGKQIQQRMDELRSRGCCQSIAWSRTGTIASITPDGQNVQLRHLQRNPTDGSWDLSEPSTCHLVKGTPTIPIVHLTWAGTSSPELGIIDAVGRVTIVSFSISLNHPFLYRKWDADPIDDMLSVVGCYWLSINPPSHNPASPQVFNVMHGPAKKHVNNSYIYETSFVHASGPTHPNPAKSALFNVSASGTLKMFWGQNNNRWEETPLELESVHSSDDLVTRAAFASERKFLLLAVTTSAKQLRLIKIEINWGGGQSDKNPPQSRSLSPSLVEKHLATTNWLQGGVNEINQESFPTALSHLEVLPSSMDNTGKNTASPMIIAIRSRAANDGSFQMVQSTIDRWEVVENKQNLHSAFEQLGSRRNSTSSELPTSMRLRKLDPINLNKVVIGFHSMTFGKVLVIAFADGSIEYRDRFTFEELYTTEDTNRVMSLRQVGWNFADEGPCQQVSFSPTNCSMVQMGDDGKVRWNKLHYTLPDFGNTMHDPHYAASIAGLTVAAGSAMFYQNNFDDILAIVRPYVDKRRFTQDLIGELIRILKIQVDYSEDTHHDALVRNASLQSCLSILNSLGFRGEFQPRSFQSKFSMLALGVRNVVVLVTIASNTPLTVREKLSPLDEPEVVETLAGCAKWSLDLLSWLIDCLFELMNDNQFMERLAPQRFGELTPYLHEKHNVSLHFLLSSSSRGFLSALCRRLGHLELLSTRAIEFYRRQSASSDASVGGKVPNPDLQQAYQRMQRVTSSSLVKVNEFEKLLSALSSDIRHSYQAFLPNFIKAQSSNAPQGKNMDVAIKTAQIQFELAMLLSATPPPAFLQVINKFFRQDLPAFREQTDPSLLFFANYDLLEVEDDERSLSARRAKGIYVDVFKRVELRMEPTKQWRRCARCAAVMEDIFGSRPGYSFVLGQQRKCACGGHWALLQRGKLLGVEP